MAIPRNLANIAPHVNASSTELVVNDAGANLDFRVEGDTDANLFVVDASADQVFLGAATSLQGKLQVSAVGTTIVSSRTTANAFGSNVIFAKSRGGTDIVSSGDNLGNLIWAGANGTGYNNAASISAQVDGTPGASDDMPGRLVFSTTPDGSGTVTERARITSAGYFKASNSGTYIDANGAYHEFNQSSNAFGVRMKATSANYNDNILHLQSTRAASGDEFNFLLCGTDSGSTNKFIMRASGNCLNVNNSYGSLSDLKLKQDLVDAASQWDDIKNIRVRKFRFKNDPTGFLQIGLIAQELEEVSPGLVEESPDYEDVEVPVLDDEGNPVLNEDGEPQTKIEQQATGTVTKAVKYSVLYMKAVKALQEAIERIETLEAKVAALEAQ